MPRIVNPHHLIRINLYPTTNLDFPWKNPVNAELLLEADNVILHVKNLIKFNINTYAVIESRESFEVLDCYFVRVQNHRMLLVSKLFKVDPLNNRNYYNLIGRVMNPKWPIELNLTIYDVP